MSRQQHVFARNTNGDLIQYWWNPNQSWAAENLTQRGNIGAAYRIASDPVVDQFLREAGVPTEHVFARNTNGDLIQYWWNPNQSWAAENLTQRGNIGAAYRIASDPAVGSFGSAASRWEHVFARNTNGDLIQYWWNPNQSWAAENLTQRGNIGTAYRIASDPAVDQFPEGDVPTQHVFARNTNGDLIQYSWNPNQSWAAENLTQRRQHQDGSFAIGTPTWACGSSRLGERQGGLEGALRLTEVVEACRLALAVRTRNDLPQQWAETQTNLGCCAPEPDPARRLAEGCEQVDRLSRAEGLRDDPVAQASLRTLTLVCLGSVSH